MKEMDDENEALELANESPQWPAEGAPRAPLRPQITTWKQRRETYEVALARNGLTDKSEPPMAFASCHRRISPNSPAFKLGFDLRASAVKTYKSKTAAIAKLQRDGVQRDWDFMKHVAQLKIEISQTAMKTKVEAAEAAEKAKLVAIDEMNETLNIFPKRIEQFLIVNNSNLKGCSKMRWSFCMTPSLHGRVSWTANER